MNPMHLTILSATMIFVVLTGPVGWEPEAAARNFNSYAIVQQDGSLRVQGHTIRLYGIEIPPTGRTCLTFMRPVRCGPRAVLQLELKIDPHFVHCREVSRNADRSINALCEVEGDDLSEWMLSQGWAIALPDAPPEYFMLERRARSIGLGIWGLQADVIRKGYPRDR